MAGGLNADQKRLYHLGLEHIYHQHQRVGSFTIGQVITGEQNRENERRDAALRQQQQAEEARQRARDAAAAAAEQAKEDAAAAEQANFIHGTPDCLVLDKRTLDTQSDEDAWYIVGKVTNRCDHDLAYAQVEFNFYDSSGNQENSGLVNINNLSAGDTWSFKKPVYETISSGGTWKVAGLSGW